MSKSQRCSGSLRRYANGIGLGDKVTFNACLGVCADHIDFQQTEIARLTAEVERLKAALYEFATQYKCGCGHPHCNNCERDRMAEAALAQGE